jgi:hypothetical protein
MILQKTFFCLILLFLSLNLEAQNIVINEIITSNSSINTDEDGDYEDWIELFNTSNEAINLINYGLSDNPNNLFKWIFPSVMIQPGEHFLIWCSNKNRTNPEFPLHTNFAISAGGETITLTYPDGTIADQIPPIVIPANFSYGRSPSGSSTFAIFETPTPGLLNANEGVSETLTPPVFSVNPGFYATSFFLTISHPDPSVSIIYTLDGSEPTTDNLEGKSYLYKNQYEEFPGDVSGDLIEESFSTHVYTNAITIIDRSNLSNKIASISSTYNQNPTYIPSQNIFKGTVVRAKAIKEGSFSSETVTNTYFVTPELSDRFSLPIVSISLDEEFLFDYEDGIYVAGVDFDNWRAENPLENAISSNANYKRSGDETEKNGNFSYFINGNQILNQNIGVRINGGFSRLLPNKSLRLYARSEYGNSVFNHSFFNDSEFNSFKRLILRNSGSDAYSTYFRDAFIQKAVSHLNFDTQAYQPTLTFINGEYWGLLNLRERYDKHYFERVYNVNENELDFLEYNGFLVKEGDFIHYENMLNYIENNSLQNTSNFNYVKTQMDIENFTDYFIANIYARNTDWPHNNIEFWRKKTTQYEPDAPYGQDGRWRWILKDTDFGFGAEGGEFAYLHNTLAFATSTGGDEFTNPEWSTLILRKLLENSTFKNYFINRFADLMNTTYLPSRLEMIIDTMKSGIENEIIEHGQRWGSFQTIGQWNSNIDNMINFSNERLFYQRNHIREKFDINSNIDIQLNVSDDSHGYIKINTIEIQPTTPGVDENPYPWEGVYFKNIPITFKAIAKSGFQFSHWSGASSSALEDITLNPNENIQLIAHFIPSEVVEENVPIYFWVIDNAIANDTPLTNINSTFEIPAEGTLTFQSCLVGYPFTNTHPNWRKASMERRNSPTAINYIPEANENLSFETSGMRGLQIKQPFKNNGEENQMIFSFSTLGYQNILFGFAAKDENAADQILIDYSVTENDVSWTTQGLTSSTFDLSNNFELLETDFTSIETVNNNPNFKVRLRFDGPNMTIDNGDRVTFNNISVKGTTYNFNVDDTSPLQFNIYPNPVTDVLKIDHTYNLVEYNLFSIDGKLVQKGKVINSRINLVTLQKGLYLLQLEADGKTDVRKIIKN